MNNAPAEEVGFQNRKGEIIPIISGTKREVEEDSASPTAAKKRENEVTAAKLATFEKVTAKQFTATPAKLCNASRIFKEKFKNRGVKAAVTKRALQEKKDQLFLSSK
jgi:glycine/serine hydroxymethyltransferase